eukprot:gene38-661_t
MSADTKLCQFCQNFMPAQFGGVDPSNSKWYCMSCWSLSGGVPKEAYVLQKKFMDQWDPQKQSDHWCPGSMEELPVGWYISMLLRHRDGEQPDGKYVVLKSKNMPHKEPKTELSEGQMKRQKSSFYLEVDSLIKMMERDACDQRRALEQKEREERIMQKVEEQKLLEDEAKARVMEKISNESRKERSRERERERERGRRDWRHRDDRDGRERSRERDREKVIRERERNRRQDRDLDLRRERNGASGSGRREDDRDSHHRDRDRDRDRERGRNSSPRNERRRSRSRDPRDRQRERSRRRSRSRDRPRERDRERRREMEEPDFLSMDVEQLAGGSDVRPGLQANSSMHTATNVPVVSQSKIDKQGSKKALQKVDDNLSRDAVEAFRRQSGRQYDKFMQVRHDMRRAGIPDEREACNLCGQIGHYARDCRFRGGIR